MSLQKLIAHFKKHQCEACRNGDRTRCIATRENSNTYRIDEKGETHYYCWPGCLMVEIYEKDPEQLIKLIEDQFNREGHYEKMANP
ncbi:MAG: hypothetical protein AABX65_04860 [Nanoarchaeota archaeon]